MVLAFAFVLEGAASYLALKALLAAAGEKSFWHALRSSKDPAVFTILAEELYGARGYRRGFPRDLLRASLRQPVSRRHGLGGHRRDPGAGRGVSGLRKPRPHHRRERRHRNRAQRAPSFFSPDAVQETARISGARPMLPTTSPRPLGARAVRRHVGSVPSRVFNEIGRKRPCGETDAHNHRAMISR